MDFTLEDPLTFADGRKVASASDWAARRRELLALFEREVYGRMPPKPEVAPSMLMAERERPEFGMVERRYRQWFRTDGSGPSIDWIVFLPLGASKPSPTFLHLNYCGNDTIATGRTNHFDLPLSDMAAKGFAFMSAHYTQITSDGPDRGGAPFSGVFELLGPRDPARIDNTGSLMAWAWGLCRWLDLAEEIAEIDATRCTAIGSSRLDEWPEPYDATFARPPFGYVRRTGTHGLSPDDWRWALDFATAATHNPSPIIVNN